MTLKSENQFGAAIDDIYAALIDAHEGLTAQTSERLNARLVLILANHIGDKEVISEALKAAKSGLHRS